MDQDTAEFVCDCIEVLIKARDETFRHERLVALYELQTWVHFPDRSDIFRTAVRLAGARLLAEMEDDYVAEHRDMEPGTTATLIALLRRPVYRELFDDTVGAYGGWTNLRHEMTSKAFDEERVARRVANATVADLIDYRFRYLDHGGTDPQMANASHSVVFRWNDKSEGRGLSGRTIRKRWSAGQESAAFVYVSVKHGFNFAPRRAGAANFPAGLRAQASKTRRLRRYFGRCAYVAERLYTQTREAEMLSCFPNADALERIKPETQPLSDEDRSRLSNYKEDSLASKES